MSTQHHERHIVIHLELSPRDARLVLRELRNAPLDDPDWVPIGEARRIRRAMHQIERELDDLAREFGLDP